MSVTSPQGFAAGVAAGGLKSDGRLDVAVVVNNGPLKNAAAAFTSNRSKANPIIWSQQVITDGIAEAIVLNSGGANCFTGSFGFQTTHQTAERAAEILGVSANDILVCSTGLIGIGDQTFRDGVLEGTTQALASLGEDQGERAAEAIMTTDSVPKSVTVTGDGWTIGAMAKGAGMLAPGLATMLVVITTDAVLDAEQADIALRQATSLTFDRLDSDGCMSTNDQVTLMISGASGVEPTLNDFTDTLTQVCQLLAVKLQVDAEGASHDIAIDVVGAASVDDALEVGRSVARNNLFKAAIFGNDPNWGRVLAAIGTTTADFDPYAVDVSMNGVRVCSNGEPDRPREEVDLTPRATEVRIDLKSGSFAGTILTNDLTYEYVTENSEYAS